MNTAEIRYGSDLLAIENFKTYKEDAEQGNPYNTFFYDRIISGEFSGCAKYICDIKEFGAFVSKLKQIYDFKLDEAVLTDIGYGSSIVFKSDKRGHIKLSGKLLVLEHSLTFSFNADQTVLKPFIEMLQIWTEN